MRGRGGRERCWSVERRDLAWPRNFFPILSPRCLLSVRRPMRMFLVLFFSFCITSCFLLFTAHLGYLHTRALRICLVTSSGLSLTRARGKKGEAPGREEGRVRECRCAQPVSLHVTQHRFPWPTRLYCSFSLQRTNHLVFLYFLFSYPLELPAFRRHPGKHYVHACTHARKQANKQASMQARKADWV